MKNWRFPLLVAGTVVAINFVTMPREECLGDAAMVRLESITFLNTGRWAVPAEIAIACGPRGLHFYQNSHGNWYPKYGLLNTLIYLPPLWLEKVMTGGLTYGSDNTLALNLWNLLFSGASAVYLALLARRYTSSSRIVWFFVASSIYGTFWWYYLRAQVFEPYVTLFVLAAFFHFMGAADAGDRPAKVHLVVSGVYTALLCLAKTVYVVLIPVFGIALLVRLRRPGAPDRSKQYRQAVCFLVPAIIGIAIVGWANWYRFDSPVTTGYTQFEPERNLLTPHLLPALVGFTCSAQKSVFIHFPILLLAFAGWRSFWRRRPADALVILLGAITILLINSAFVNWKGDSCYGPRYLLPILPLVSLPAIGFTEGAWRSRPLIKWPIVGVTAAVLSFSLVLQVAANSLPFYFWYDLDSVLDDESSRAATSYLDSRPFGEVNLEFIGYSLGWPSPMGSSFVDGLSASELGRFEVKRMTPANYYWWRKPFL